MISALFVIVLLTSLTAMVSASARTSAGVSRNRQAQAEARAMAESGVLAARVRFEAMLRATGADSTRREAVFDLLEAQPAAAPPAAPPQPWVADTLAGGVFAATIVNVSARLDVNSAGAEGLARLFRTVAPPEVASRLARRIDEAVRGATAPRVQQEAAAARDSLIGALLGQAAPPRIMQPIESLDALDALAGEDAGVLARVAEQLTVDGDGRIDRRHASRTVLAAASGSLVDAPTRVLVISRGWAQESPLTREIQAVYAVEGNELRLVRWRERNR